MKRYLSKNEKERIEEDLADVETARFAFQHAAVMLKTSEKKLWTKLLAMQPGAARIHHPEGEEWYLEI